MDTGGDFFRMLFVLFALGAALAMFVGSIFLMDYGRRMGMSRSAEHRQQCDGWLERGRRCRVRFDGSYCWLSHFQAHSRDLTNGGY